MEYKTDHTIIKYFTENDLDKEGFPLDTTYIQIDFIETEIQQRGNGYARTALESLIKTLSGKIVIVASDSFGSDLSRLVAFYESLGFEIKEAFDSVIMEMIK